MSLVSSVTNYLRLISSEELSECTSMKILPFHVYQDKVFLSMFIHRNEKQKHKDISLRQMTLSDDVEKQKEEISVLFQSYLAYVGIQVENDEYLKGFIYHCCPVYLKDGNLTFLMHVKNINTEYYQNEKYYTSQYNILDINNKKLQHDRLSFQDIDIVLKSNIVLFDFMNNSRYPTTLNRECLWNGKSSINGLDVSIDIPSNSDDVSVTGNVCKISNTNVKYPESDQKYIDSLSCKVIFESKKVSIKPSLDGDNSNEVKDEKKEICSDCKKEIDSNDTVYDKNGCHHQKCFSGNPYVAYTFNSNSKVICNHCNKVILDKKEIIYSQYNGHQSIYHKECFDNNYCRKCERNLIYFDKLISINYCNYCFADIKDNFGRGGLSC